MPLAICRKLFMQVVRVPDSRTRWMPGKSSSTSSARMPITTISSISENARREELWEGRPSIECLVDQGVTVNIVG